MDVPRQDHRPLPRCTPSARGVDAAGVLAFVDALEAAPEVEPHSLMVLSGGHVVAEGWWAPYAPDGVALLYSLSKSVTSTALGLAVAEGLVSLDDTVLSHFPELEADVTDPRARRLLVRHVAAMASGHESETVDRAWAADPEDLVRGFLLTPPEREPGSVFAYNQPCTYALGAIVARRSGTTLTEYLRPRLLDPLGITDVAWTRDASGRDLAYSGLHATTDAIARLGLLYLQEGRWGDRQVLSPGWVAEATRAHVPNASAGSPPDWSLGYGFQFWRSRHGYRGDGAYGQLCLVLPEVDAVVAITAATEDTGAVLDAAWTLLLPALAGGVNRSGGAESVPGSASASSTAAPTAPTGDAALAERLAGLALPTVSAAPEPAAAGAAGWNGYSGTATAGPVASLTVDRDRDLDGGDGDGGWRITVVGRAPADAGTPLVAALGTDGWAVSHPATPDGELPLAVSGGWTPEGALRADLVFLETPHRLALTATPGDGTAAGGGSVTSRWLTEPLGDVPLVHLRAPRR